MVLWAMQLLRNRYYLNRMFFDLFGVDRRLCVAQNLWLKGVSGKNVVLTARLLYGTTAMTAIRSSTSPYLFRQTFTT